MGSTTSLGKAAPLQGSQVTELFSALGRMDNTGKKSGMGISETWERLAMLLCSLGLLRKLPPFGNLVSSGTIKKKDFEQSKNKRQYMESEQSYKIFTVLSLCRCRFWRRDPAQPDLKTKQLAAGTTHPHPAPSAQNKKSRHSHKSFIHPSSARRTFVSSHFASLSPSAGSAQPPFQLPAGTRILLLPVEIQPTRQPRRLSKTTQGCHSTRVGSGVAKVVVLYSVKVFKWQFLGRYIPFWSRQLWGTPHVYSATVTIT